MHGDLSCPSNNAQLVRIPKPPFMTLVLEYPDRSYAPITPHQDEVYAYIYLEAYKFSFVDRRNTN